MTQPLEEGKTVDARPVWLRNVQAEGTQPGTITIDDKVYQYTIVRPGLAEGLPYTVGFPNESALFISIDVPEEYRPLIMSHEVREKTRFADLPEEERCRASLQLEVEDARGSLEDRFPGYIAERTAFFDRLVGLYETPEQQAAVTPQFRQAIQASRDYLHSLPLDNPTT